MSSSLAGDWARLFFGSLAGAGLTDVVVSPGSRSTPFVWAAAATRGLTCHSAWDERSAAFWALGHARVTGRPVALLSTSGTAAANYYPAVVEASLARVPLLVITADRPLELQDAAAPQTIDQIRLYGRFARRSFDLGAPDGAPLALAALQRLAAQALLASLAPEPGAVHVNARARKPLEPTPARTDDERRVAHEVDALLARGVPKAPPPSSSPSPEALALVVERLQKSRRTLAVAGPLGLREQDAARALAVLSERLALPLYAEATSGARFGSGTSSADGLDWVLRSERGRALCRPELVLRIGGPPASAGVERLLAGAPSPELIVLGGEPFSDPTSSASVFVSGPPLAVVEALAGALAGLEPHAEQKAYAAQAARANRAAWCAVEQTGSDRELDEPSAVRIAVEAVPEDGVLMLGNSLPVREVDAYVRSGRQGLGVLSQRGASGIDGLVSGAAGSASAAKKPLLLLLGDVSLAHDLGGLALARRVQTPLVIVVLDNGGGRIFEQLPVARLIDERPEHAELWLTPPEVAFEDAARAFGIDYAAPASRDELVTVLERAFADPGTTLVHVRAGAHAARDRLQAVIAAAERGLAELSPEGS